MKVSPERKTKEEKKKYGGIDTNRGLHEAEHQPAFARQTPSIQLQELCRRENSLSTKIYAA
jgi:hypothetical protein